ncbi:MAG TPA: PLP-dependent aspartate aminotransferase family protein [Thermoanaerobaculia bacterium]|jgi:cystathionine gamma-lyase/cystathionine beta-lyase/cystathionine gamma-lyase/homocysteine desulfhydrase|nr:PLP-dependent aspartate aminotransferase family protein [Thermoanaerobaculia bacterium]
MKGDPRRYGFATRAIHAGQPPDAATGAVTVPIYMTSTYVHEGLGEHKGFEYTRVHNPTRFALEDNVAALENGVTGHAFASGMAAISALLTLVKAGEHVVVSQDVYGGTYRFFTQVLERYGLRFSWIDATSTAAIEAAMEPQTKLLFLETPTNPLMQITDLAAAAEIAHRHGALVAVDNTFLSPCLQRPLDLGCDVVVHSTTKYLNGHSDALGGVLVARNREQGDWFYFVQKSVGGVMSPFDSFLVLRGIKTLPIRVERCEENARVIAAFLADHPRVERVLYPGLPNHPGYEIQQRQASGFGAMISFDLGSYEAAKRFLDRLEVMSLAESLGGVETLISHPATMTHASVPADRRAALGIGDGLVRVSVGIEDRADLLADLQRGLDAV